VSVAGGAGPTGAFEPVGGQAVPPAEERLAARLDERRRARAPGASSPVARLLHRMGRYDRSAYLAVSRLRTPALDAPLRRLSHAANHSKPWFAVAGVLAVTGGPTGRRAALTGVAAIGAASLVVNQPMKLLGDRRRPDRTSSEVPPDRWVPMPTSSSFPSGHSASALAFAVAVGGVVPALRVPLGAAAGTVAFSRVYTGVHYPGDVLVGAATGAVLGRLVARAGARLPRR
jgi:undecaprenyl-diphosphatase